MNFSSGFMALHSTTLTTCLHSFRKIAGEWRSSNSNACRIGVVAVKHQRPELKMKFPRGYTLICPPATQKLILNYVSLFGFPSFVGGVLYTVSSRILLSQSVGRHRNRLHVFNANLLIAL
jgi:hypothetical protein